MYGRDDHGELLGRVLCGFAGSSEGLYLELNGGYAHLDPEGDCCSHSWIEHLSGATAFRPGRVVRVEDVEMPEPTAEEELDHEYLQVYGTRIVLDNGIEVLIDYRNSSNGYYGGWLNWSVHRGTMPSAPKIEEDF